MQYKTVVTDQNLFEKIHYPDAGFPLLFYEDRLDDFLGGEVTDHWHDELEFQLVLQGSLQGCIHHGAAREEQTLRPGDGMFIQSKTLHCEAQTSPGTVVFGVEVPAEAFSMLPMEDIYPKNIAPVVQSPVSGLFLRRGCPADRPLLDCLEELRQLGADSPCYALHCMELVCRLWRSLFTRIADTEGLPALSKAEQVQDRRVRVMLSFIHAHYSEPLSIDDIAKAANISRSECFRCFRSVLGRTPADYLCRYRLARAADLLANTGQPLVEICFGCGFKSMSYFGKRFREHCGQSPGRYRRQSRP